MVIQDIIDSLNKWSPINRENGSDFMVYGDANRNVSKIAVCMIATPDVLRKAEKLGAEFIITHEPTFHESVKRYKGEENYFNDKVYLAKKQLVEELDIPIYRFHDYSHFTDIDKINAGFIKKLAISGTFDGEKTFVLDNPMTVDELESEIKNKLNLRHIRLVGQRNKKVKNISLCAGAWGDTNVYKELNRDGIDLVICGEITEYSICEYVRDSAQLGIDKALFILGHMGSERAGMEYVCEYINDAMGDIKAVYIECDEVYN
ncbi:MAG: Nif3-like dinuclear metal center hexameric protein [Clostridia bacterium]|nr:Nif3-like dinuclear metal center hexameric protein [Clostridia bacterium]